MAFNSLAAKYTDHAGALDLAWIKCILCLIAKSTNFFLFLKIVNIFLLCTGSFSICYYFLVFHFPLSIRILSKLLKLELANSFATSTAPETKPPEFKWGNYLHYSYLFSIYFHNLF